MTYFNSLLSLSLSPRARGLIVDIGLTLEAGDALKVRQVVDQTSTLSLKKTINELRGLEDDLSLEQINDITYIYELILICIK